MRLIDADALQRAMFNYYGCVNEHTSKSAYTGDTLMDYEVAGLIEDCIDNAPTIDAVEVVQGRWEDGAFANSKKCGVCGRYATKVHVYNQPIFDYVVCPYCGARMMDGEEKK